MDHPGRSLLAAGALCLLLGPTGFDAVAADPVQPTPIRDGSALTLSTSATTPLLEEAQRAAERGDLQKAEELYQSVLISNPTNLKAILALARVYERMRKLEYARGLLLRASLLSPLDKEIEEWNARLANNLSLSLHHEIDSLIAGGSYDLAVPKISILLTLEPENPDLHYLKALCHFKVDRPEVARLEVEKAMKLRGDPRYNALHRSIERRAREKEVESLVRRAASMLAGESGGGEEASDLIARILELDPDNPWARRVYERLRGAESPPLPRGSRAPLDLGKAWSYLIGVARALSDNLPYLLVILFLFFLLDSPLTKSLTKGLPFGGLLAGRLELFPPAQVLSMLHAGERTGRLRIRGRGIKGDVYLDKGEAYHCRCGKEEGKRALELLIKEAREGRFVFFDDHSSLRRTIDTPLTLILMDIPGKKNLPYYSRKHKAKRRSKLTQLLEEKEV